MTHAVTGQRSHVTYSVLRMRLSHSHHGATRLRQQSILKVNKLGKINKHIVIDSCTQHFSNPVQNNQLMLNGAVSVFYCTH
jgi:hypothetical protein